MNKLVHYSVAGLFILFGLVQYNDPDFYIWVPVYLLVAAIPILHVTRRLHKTFSGFCVIGIGIWMLTYVPDLVNWISGGMESITGSMKAESPHIELTREFFGLLLCFVTTLVYFRLLKKKPQ